MAPPLHERIREARERRGLTQGTVAKAVGVGVRTVGNWERGESVPRNRLARLEDVLGVDLRDRPAGGESTETLSELVQRRMRDLGMVQEGGDVNIRELQRRGAVGGKNPPGWSYENVRQIVRGIRVAIEDDTAETLSRVLSIPISDVYTALGQRTRGRPFELPAYAAALTAPERQLIIGVIDAILGYPDDNPDLPRQRRTRRAGAPQLDLSQGEGLRLAEPGSMEHGSVNDNGDTQ